jgi:hypothetical protein
VLLHRPEAEGGGRRHDQGRYADIAAAERERMDFVVEVDNEGRIWVSDSDGTPPEEAWLQDANDTPEALRASGLCLLEEKYTSGTLTSTTLDLHEIAGQLWVEAIPEI